MPIDEQEETSGDSLGEVIPLTPADDENDELPSSIVQLKARTASFTNSSIALKEPEISDNISTASVALEATPNLTSSTQLIASAEAGIIRFSRGAVFDADTMKFGAAVRQRLNEKIFGQLGWNYVQLKNRGFNLDDKRLLQQNSVYLNLEYKESLAENLYINPFYQFKARFADPTDRSRLSHTLGTELKYNLASNVETALGYQLTLDDYTKISRFDTIHRLKADVTYRINQALFVTGLVAYQFGSSSDDALDPENLSVGIEFGLDLPLF
ncbi:outer membrane beta-barrel protein [Leptolyngbya cf. ectocarpi LEGE 11479]|uniref:Outer membrane beta-barrel protein n=1 Tax=Leptolyngbya cf. ectocarpi LEGE 11479 TaxID=1828722 RepID=A0A928ZXC3_LEPEC|nr:outer membrane beta-barrel protein [Leptolyngbya ectocarpi]MBE9069181.1 outer membrane beta-barrel protein [Leptolyngbya cf. ectocarpi LEGE 11479]